MNCQSLNEVQNLLKEFHSLSSSNERMRQIEQQIELFKNRPDTWKICLEALESVDNQMLWFFCCSTAELLVTNRWHTLDAESKIQMRQAVWNLCLQIPKLKTTNIEKNKLCQLVALIAKREFPNDDPDFMNRLVDVLQTNFPLGVTIFAAINTEIVSTKADVTTEKKRDFQRAVEMYFSLVMPVLQRNLSLIACRICGGAGLEATEERLFQHLFVDPNRLTAITIEFLTCLQTIFSWANLDKVLTNEMLTVIFALANWNEEWSDVRITALATITDLFYRQRASALVTETAVGIIQLIHQPDLPNADDYYQDRLTELLRLFTEQQWKKWVNTPDFPVHVYLTLLLNFTFACNSSAIGARLEIWKPIVAVTKKNGTQEVKEIVMQLFVRVLERIQFDCDPDLDLLDNQHLDDNLTTEYQIFQNQCCDVIVGVAEIEPAAVYEKVVTTMNRSKGPMEWFTFIVNALPSKYAAFDHQTTDKAALAVLNDAEQSHTVHSMLRDLSTLSQIIARLGPLVMDVNGSPPWLAESIQTVTHAWMAAVRVVATKQISSPECYHLNNYNDFHTTIAQLLTAVKFMILLAPLKRSNLVEMEGFVDLLAQFLLPAQSGVENSSSIIQLASARVLLTITSELRLKFIIENGHVQALATADLSRLEEPVKMCIYKIMCNLFLLPWDDVAGQQTDQQYPHRQKLLEDYINMALAASLVHLDTSNLLERQSEVLTVLQSVLPIISDILDHYQTATSQTKMMLKQATSAVVERCVEIYRLVGTQNPEIAETVLSFFLSVMRALQLQLGATTIRDYLGLFLAGTSSSCANTGIAGLRSLELLLKIELVIVEQPGTAAMALIPEMLTIALDQIIPLIRSNENNRVSEYTDLTMAAYLLFDGILLNRWQYFYTSQVKRGFSPGASDVLAHDVEVVHHAEHFLGILTAYGQAIVCRNDPELTRTVLLSLENVEKRCRLYSREFFQKNLLSQFLSALLSTITAPEGIILFDLLIEVLYKMARTSVPHLHQALVEFGNNGNAQFVNDLCSAEDLPTFTHFMQQIIQDIKVLRAGL